MKLEAGQFNVNVKNHPQLLLRLVKILFSVFINSAFYRVYFFVNTRLRLEAPGMVKLNFRVLV